MASPKILLLASALSACLLVSCEAFSRPVYTLSRDVSAVIGSMSTADLADNIDKLATDPQKAADVLNELASRNQDEIEQLSKTEKEKLLTAGVGAVLPTSQLGEAVGALTSGGDMDFKTVMESLCSGSVDVNTRALETVLKDGEVLGTTDASTLALSAASLIVATVKKEGDSGSVDSKMEAFKTAASEASKDGTFNESTFKEKLKDSFGSQSIESLTVAMETASVLTGTAGAGKPNRKEDAASVGFGGYSMEDLLDQMTGGKK